MRLNFVRPSWQKVLADLWINKTRTLLVVASIAVGVIAMTKCDLPDPDWMELVEEEIREFVVRLADRNESRLSLRFDVSDTGIGIEADQQRRNTLPLFHAKLFNHRHEISKTGHKTGHYNDADTRLGKVKLT